MVLCNSYLRNGFTQPLDRDALTDILYLQRLSNILEMQHAAAQFLEALSKSDVHSTATTCSSSPSDFSSFNTDCSVFADAARRKVKPSNCYSDDTADMTMPPHESEPMLSDGVPNEIERTESLGLQNDDIARMRHQIVLKEIESQDARRSCQLEVQWCLSHRDCF